MKLQDIFKLDLNTGGGNKLFARIMNKYNIPKKEYEKVKDKLENFSGGGDSGSSDNERLDEPLYYKIELPEDASSTQKEYWDTMLYTILSPNSYIVLKGESKDMPNIEVPILTSIPYPLFSKIKFKITNKYLIIREENEYRVNFFKVNVVDLLSVISEMFEEDEINFIEISKEEYYLDIEVKYEDIPIQQMQ